MKHIPILNKDFKFIKIDDNKKFIKEEDLENYGGNLGLVIEKPYIVLEFDSNYYFEQTVNMLMDSGYKTPMIRYGIGGAIWFKSEQEFANGTSYLPTLIDVKIKSFNETNKQFVLMKEYGFWNDWLIQVDEIDEVAELPFWLKPTKKKWTNITLEDFQENLVNETLYKMIYPLKQALFFDDQQVKTILKLINKHLLIEKINSIEIDKMFIKGTEYDKLKEQAVKFNFFDERGKFMFDEFSDFLMNEFNVTKYNGKLWIFDEDTLEYKQGQEEIRRVIRKINPKLKKSLINESIWYINDLCEETFDRYNPIKWIKLKNCYYNTATHKTANLQKRIFTPIKLNIDLRKKDSFNDKEKLTISYIQEKVLEIFSQNKDQFRFLMEILGYCLVPHTLAQKAFFFWGESGSNGKSIILEHIIRPFFSDENTSSLKFSELSKDFLLDKLANSLVNIDPDGEDFRIHDTSNFKKLVTGDQITVNVKFENPYTTLSTTKFIISYNDLPKVKDSNEAFFRRIEMLIFKERFSVEQGNIDPTLATWIQQHRKVINEWLLINALEGLQRLEANSWQFTQVPDNNVAFKNFKSNSEGSVWNWITDQRVSNQVLEGQQVADIYDIYIAWCGDFGVKYPFGKINFVKKLKAIFNMDTKNKSINGKTVATLVSIK